MSEKKKINTPLFMVLATLLNLALVAGVFILLVLFLAFINSRVAFSSDVFMLLLGVAVIVSFIIALFLYKKILTLLSRKWDIGGGKDRDNEA